AWRGWDTHRPADRVGRGPREPSRSLRTHALAVRGQGRCGCCNRRDAPPGPREVTNRHSGIGSGVMGKSSPMLRRLLTALAVVVLLVGGWFLWLMNAAGEFRTLRPHFEGSCTAVPVVGAEDLTIHPRTGIAYVSSCDRWALFAGKPPHAAISAYDLNAASPRPVNLTPDASPTFSPHGVSLYVAPDGASTLFVIN